MNLGQAVAVCVYEVIRSTVASRQAPENKQPAAAEDVERITGLLLRVLARSGYVHARVAGSTEMKTRRLVRRMNLTAHDGEVWLGMLRQIAWKLEPSGPE